MSDNLRTIHFCRTCSLTGDLYRESHRSLGEAAWADIDAELPWSVYTRLYTACFDAASFWQMAQKAGAEAQEKGDGYGVEVAWLRVAENACRKALEAVQASKLKPEVKATIDTSSASALLEQVRFCPLAHCEHY